MIKDILIMLGVLGVIVLAHVIPELAVRILPQWVILIIAVAFFTMLIKLMMYCFRQAFNLDNEER
jgi:predicted acyltransferase